MDSAGESYTSAMARNRISKATRALMKSLKIQGASFYTLRHTAGSWAAQAGESGVIFGQFLGHAALTMTDRYTRRTATFCQTVAGCHNLPYQMRAGTVRVRPSSQGPSIDGPDIFKSSTGVRRAVRTLWPRCS